MMVIILLVVGGILLAATFILAPLVHDEGDIKPLRRPRPGTRHLHGVEDLGANNGVERTTADHA